MGWVDARPCGVSQLCWHACGGATGGPCAASTQLLLAAGCTDGGVQLFHQTGEVLARAASSSVPRGSLLLRLGTALQPDMRTVTCLAISEQVSPSSAKSGMPRVDSPNVHPCVHHDRHPDQAQADKTLQRQALPGLHLQSEATANPDHLRCVPIVKPWSQLQNV